MIALAILFIGIFFLIVSIWYGAVYAPSSLGVADEMIKIAAIKPGEKALDLGSGDGKVVIALARAGAQAHGYEINPFLFVWSLVNVRKAGVSKKAHIHFGSFWNKDVSQYDVVTIFLIPYIIKRLEKKLRKELKPGARVIVESFPFPNWKPIKKEGSLYMYKR